MRLTRAVPYRGGWTRRRRGRGFSYHAADGSALGADARARVDGLVIPPAWRDVWISDRERDHIQAVGYDVAGRRQYVYHPRWHADRDSVKHDRVLALARRLPRFRSRVDAALAVRGTGRDRVLGAAMRILDLGVFRTGGEQYATENGTYGLSTLRREHVRLRGGGLEFAYTAKGGIHRQIRIRDDGLLRVVRSLRRARPDGDRFLVHRDGRTWRAVHSDDLNDHFRTLTADEHTAKDLRTWNATVVAAVALAGHGTPTSATALRRAEAAAMRAVAEALGNTPAVARSSYVDPRIVHAFENGRTVAAGLRRIPAGTDVGTDPRARARVERAVLRLLESA
ncbi:DNA topoisomerase IB [Pseudonocardia sp. HH130630-07]|uniref:DNA topoisomerase IB n=1 Tax=Pseudonocardia sp. HH130630-07 TaxID=1690815 RepID=UPI000814C799|nr:DNA topoisomerase IB [Pseudonocardia sp. HH130630-07]ANY08707.1 DNA topoisomerase [Pseudonocardia sp. HH130630-07]